MSLNVLISEVLKKVYTLILETIRVLKIRSGLKCVIVITDDVDICRLFFVFS